MNAATLSRLARAMAEAGLARLELEGPDFALRLDRSRPTDDLPAPTRGSSNGRAAAVTVRSPAVGTFLRAHPLHDRPLAATGDRVGAGEPLGLVRVGDVLLPVPAPTEGWVVAELAAPGSLVGFGDPLLELRPVAEEEGCGST